jgi:hypothetical protein
MKTKFKIILLTTILFVGSLKSFAIPSNPKTTPAEYFAQGFSLAYSLGIQNSPGAESMYNNTLALALVNGQVDYYDGLITGHAEAQIKLLGNYNAPIILTSANPITTEIVRVEYNNGDVEYYNAITYR